MKDRAITVVVTGVLTVLTVCCSLSFAEDQDQALIAAESKVS